MSAGWARCTVGGLMWLLVQVLAVSGMMPERSLAARVALKPIVSEGISRPVYVAQPPDGTDRLFILEQAGHIRIVRAGTLLERPFLDVAAKVLSSGYEQGLLGLAFHPDYRHNGRYVVNYTRVPDGATVVAEYRVSAEADVSAAKERVLLTIPQPYANHNGGMVEFGPDGYLYIGMGDGGAGGDPQDRGQNRQELLGKVLRIDVDAGDPYGIPPDNPFVKGGGRPEIFAYGLRNPWRFSFDRTTGALWVGDVGQNDWEEIDIVTRGGNYGWRIMEGAHCFRPKTGCDPAGLTLPVAEYPLRPPRCSIIGGYVYRGSRIAKLAGTYVFGDFCSGEIFGLVDGRPEVLLKTTASLSSFGQDASGELYAVGHRGKVYRLVPGGAAAR